MPHQEPGLASCRWGLASNEASLRDTLETVLQKEAHTHREAATATSTILR